MRGLQLRVHDLYQRAKAWPHDDHSHHPEQHKVNRKEHGPMATATLGNLNLDPEMARLAPGDSSSGRRAETLIKTDRLRVVLITMRTGATLQEHIAQGPITIQVLRGAFAVNLSGEEHVLSTGGLIALAGETPHAVRALDDGAFLLTLVWDPAWRGEAGGLGPQVS
jgi:quercetin dioxygenase-like cupin family protein